MKRWMAGLLSVMMLLSGGCAMAEENAKNERVYVVTGADGSVRSLTDVIRLENRDGSETLTDRTGLDGIENVGGPEGFTLQGEALVWQAAGKDITYEGTSGKKPAVVPVAELTLEGETVTAAALKEKEGEAALTVRWQSEESYPVLAVTVMPLPEGATDLRLENAALMTEAGRKLVVGWGVTGLDESLGLKDGFSVRFHADHAAPGWMMTAALPDPAGLLGGALRERIGLDGEVGLETVRKMLEAARDGEPMPLSAGKTGEAALAVNMLTGSVDSLNDGAEKLDSGLTALKGNNEALMSGADQILAAALKSANDQLTASGLAAAGITVPELTAENYAEVLDGLAEKLKMLQPQAADSLRAAKEQLDQLAAFRDGLKTYTDGVAAAADGAGTLKSGLSTLTGTLTDAVSKAAGTALETLEKGEKLIVASGEETGYDLRPEGMRMNTVYLIRTDFD